MGGNDLLQLVKISRRDVHEAGGQGLKKLVIMLLTRSGQSGQRTAVEAVLQRDDRAIFSALFVGSVFARQLDGALVCLGTRVGEKDLFETRLGAKQLSKASARVGIIEVGGVCNAVKLCRYRLAPRRICVTQSRHTDARAHIDILLALLVIAK